MERGDCLPCGNSKRRLKRFGLAESVLDYDDCELLHLIKPFGRGQEHRCFHNFCFGKARHENLVGPSECSRDLKSKLHDWLDKLARDWFRGRVESKS